MTKLYQPILHHTLIYIDDILLFSQTIQEYNELLLRFAKFTKNLVLCYLAPKLSPNHWAQMVSKPLILVCPGHQGHSIGLDLSESPIHDYSLIVNMCLKASRLVTTPNN